MFLTVRKKGELVLSSELQEMPIRRPALMAAGSRARWRRRILKSDGSLYPASNVMLIETPWQEA